MTRRRPPHIPLRRPVYVGCEGASEAGYAALLQNLILHKGIAVHLVIDELGPGAGDPLSRIEMAVRRLDRLRKTRVLPEDRFALLDADQMDRDPQRAQRAVALAATNGIKVVSQRTCFEAMVLRHLPGKTASRPPDTPTALKALHKEWPDYEKPMTRAKLASRIDLAAIQRAATVEDELREFLECVGLLGKE